MSIREPEWASTFHPAHPSWRTAESAVARQIDSFSPDLALIHNPVPTSLCNRHQVILFTCFFLLHITLGVGSDMPSLQRHFSFLQVLNRTWRLVEGSATFTGFLSSFHFWPSTAPGFMLGCCNASQLTLKVQSRLLLFVKFLQAKSSHFDRIPIKWSGIWHEAFIPE